MCGSRSRLRFSKHGADYVKQSLYPAGTPQNFRQRLIQEGLPPDLYREDLIDIAQELSLMGLDKVAAIALEVSELKQSRFDKPSWPTTSRYSREDMQRQREQWQLKRKWQSTYGRLWTGGKVPPEKFWHSYDTQKCWDRFGIK